MKNLKHLLFITISFLSLSAYAQSNKKTLNYQAVILDPKAIDIPGASITGQPLNKGNVCLQFSLLNATGGLDYEETQQVTTDEFGLVSVAIGTGSQAQAGNSTSVYQSFESIVWNASVKSLKVSVSYDGCSSFKQVSTQSFNYTPYALYAEAVDYKNVREAPTKLSQFSNDEGFLIPKDLNPLKTDIQSNSSKIATANQNIADNKQASDATFLVVNQNLTSIDKQVVANTSSITTINTKITDQQNQITVNNNTMNAQFGGLQGQLNVTNSTVSNLTGVAEMQSNKSTDTNLGGANPSDQAYPSQKAAKAYVDQVISQIATTGVPDATTLAAGKVQLAGDLGGTATSPTVPALAGKENTANKSLNVLADGTDNTKYPSVKAVKDYVDQATLGTALAADLANKANIASPAFTGTPTAPTLASSDNSTKLATTAFVQTATTGIALQATVDAKANINSPTFTGTPTAPTPTLGDNSTKLATTAYVDAQVSAGAVDASSSSKGIVQLTGDLSGTALSPSVVKLRGTPISSIAPATAGHVLTYDVSGSATWAAPANSANTISGVVPVANGGTGLSSVTNGGAVYATSSSALTTGTLPITAGGTGASTANSALNALVPDQASNTGKYLTTDGTNTSWSGVTATSYSGTLPVLNGGTGQTTIAGIQAVLGLAGTKVAIGADAGKTNQAEGAFAFGGAAGQTNQGAFAVALGYVAGGSSQGTRSIAIGVNAAQYTQGANAVAIGDVAGQISQGANSVAIGTYSHTAANAVAIGGYATASFANSTAIGYKAATSAANTIQLGGDGVVTGSTAITNVKTTGTLTAGTVTYPNTHNATAGQVLSINSTGSAAWTTPGGVTHTIGESYGGGIVFYVWDGGAHGLIGANTELNNGQAMTWGGGSNSYVGTTSFYGVLGGKLNTQRILNVIPVPTYGNGDPGTGPRSAAFWAATYLSSAVVVGGVTITPQFSDWYLPNAYELTLFAAQSAYFPNCNFATHVHWSSSERSDYAYLAYALGANSSTNTYQDAKSSTNYVVAIRSF